VSASGLSGSHWLSIRGQVLLYQVYGRCMVDLYKVSIRCFLGVSRFLFRSPESSNLVSSKSDMFIVSSVSAPQSLKNNAVTRRFFFMYSFFSRSRMVLVWFRDGFRFEGGSERGR